MRGTKFFGAGASLVALIVLLLICAISTAQIIPGRYIVVFRDDVPDPPAAAAAVARANGFAVGHVYSFAIKGFCASIPDAALPAVKANPRVAYVEPDLAAYAVAQVDQTLPTGVDRIDADLNTITGEGVDIAIIDTGIDIDHLDLEVVGGRHFYSIRRGNRLYSYEDDNYDDDNGHGSHCAGIAAAIDNSIGVVGVAPGARLLGVKVLDANGSGYVSDIVKGIDWVTELKEGEQTIIEVANMSLAWQGNSSTARMAIQNSVSAGIVYVVAAANKSKDVYGPDGNFGTSDDFEPASYPEVATISAMADYDGQPGGLGGSTSYGPDDSFATFSNYSGSVVSDNPVTSPGAAIDLLLPGVDIYSTYKNGGYTTMSGTSMASPHAAGLAALYIAVNGRASDAAGVYAIRQALINGGVAQGSPQGLATLNDPDSNRETIGWAGSLEPMTDIAITAVSAPSSVVQGAVVDVNVTVENVGNQDVDSDIDVTLTDDGVPIGTKTISGGLAAGASTTLTYTWNTTGASIGDHTLIASHDFSDGNDSNDSMSTTVTVNEEQPENFMHVAAIEMSPGGSRKAGRNTFVWAKATVTVVDADGSPVSDATVYGHWSGATSDTDSGITDSSGLVSLLSNEVKNPPDGTTFTFWVDGVAKDGWTYDSNANVETFDSITYSEDWPSTGGSVALLQAFPTPGNPEVWLPFKLASTERVVIRIYNAAGRLVRILDLGTKAPGAYVSKEKAAHWDGRNESGEEATSGIYFYLMEAGSFRAMKKMIILK